MTPTRTSLVLLTLTLTLGTQTADARLVRECKTAACRKAINTCVKQSCSQLHGAVKGGCVKAARIALRTTCNGFLDHAAYCNELSRSDCSPN